MSYKKGKKSPREKEETRGRANEKNLQILRRIPVVLHPINQSIN